MDVSIITPYYKGRKYLKQYLKSLTISLKEIEGKFSYEVIIINDSPEEEVIIEEETKQKLNIKVVTNENNKGIHQSRINGIHNSSGKYILFLDQDDEITQNAIEIFLNSIGDYDVCIGNGDYELNDGKENIFKNYVSGNFSTKKLFYLYVKNFIISPGQCLIKRTAIPKEWMNKVLTNNGADDFLLWLLMFNQNKKFVYVHKKVYIHKYTGENLSIQRDKMFESNKQLLSRLEECNYSRKDLARLTASIEYKYYYKEHFIKETLKHFNVFLYNIAYKLVWRGCIVTEKKIVKGCN